MSSSIVKRSAALPSVSTPIEDLIARAQAYAVDARAPATRKAYLSDFETFTSWCALHRLIAFPATPGTVAVYLAAMADAGKAPPTIERALAGIAYVHRQRGYEWPRAHAAIARVMHGIRRTTTKSPHPKSAITEAELLRMVATTAAGTLTDLRDRAVLLVGFFGAFRRAELVALNVDDLSFVREGLRIRVRRAKNDQIAAGAEKGLPFTASPELCPVRALRAWLDAASITEGPLFRAVGARGSIRATALSDRSVALVVQRAAKRAGMDPKLVAGHSLRSGFATTAAAKGKGLDAIMRQTLHRSEKVARAYIRHASVFTDNAASGIA